MERTELQSCVGCQRQAAAFHARHGTTTAMLYSAIYEDSTEAAFHAAARSGLRIIMGMLMAMVANLRT